METYETQMDSGDTGLATSARPRSRREAQARQRANGRIETDEKLSKALGWFSIGLGLAQITAPGHVAGLIGLDDDGINRKVMRAIGVREIAAGVGILAQPSTPGWLWARVAGDVMDLALLGTALRSDEHQRSRLLAAGAAVAGVAALDAFTGARLRQDASGESQLDTTVRKSITVNAPREEVYRFWRDFENLPRFMKHLESVTVLGDNRSLWRATAPAGKTVEWTAEMTEDRPNELIAWRSIEGSDVHNEGRVQFLDALGDRGTEIHVELRYDPPAGAVGKAIAKLFIEEPSQQVKGDLRRFKQVMELGEVVRSEATYKGQRIKQHPGQPPEERVTT